jgi:hypothetical protein
LWIVDLAEPRWLIIIGWKEVFQRRRISASIRMVDEHKRIVNKLHAVCR